MGTLYKLCPTPFTGRVETVPKRPDKRCHPRYRAKQLLRRAKSWQLCLLLVLSGALSIRAQDVLTYHNDNARTGQNLNETILTPSNVNSTTFGKLFVLSADGKVDAQPLYMSAVAFPGQGTHNVLFVATEHDSVYAFDADTGAVLWQVSLLKSGETPSDNRNCDQVFPEIGVTATPVIDRSSGPNGALYGVAMSKDGSGNYFHRLHALDITTGAELFGGPKDVQATFPGSGANSIGGNVVFDPKQYKERPGLLLLNHVVYTSWASHCDIDPYTGWVIGYDESTLAQVSVLDFTPNGSEGSVWASGAGPASDAGGNIYFLAANGSFDTTLDVNGFPSGGDYGNAFLKLSTSGNKLAVADYFNMYNTVAQSSADQDLGSGGALVLPDMIDALGKTRHLAVGAGKDQNVYLVDRDNMGKFNPNNNNAIYQELPGALNGSEFAMPAYFSNKIYYGAVGDSIQAFQFSNARLSSTPVSKTATPFAYPGTTPSVSASGASTGIVWAAENTNPAVLHAYDATDLSRELYNSDQAPLSRDQFGAGNKFITPTVANGKVYVGTQTGVGVFGLLASLTPTTVTISPTSLSFVSQVAGTKSTPQTVTLTDSGTAPLAVSSITTSGDFAQTNTCGSPVAVGSSCTISVTFTPVAGGGRTGTVTMTDNATGSPHRVSLSGTGEDFSISAQPGSSSSATIAAGQSATYKLAVTPVGGFNQVVTLVCSGAPSAATCSVTPSSVALDGSSVSSATVTVTTTARSTMAPRPQAPGMSGLKDLRPLLWRVGLTLLAGLAFAARQRTPPRGVVAGLALTLLFIIFWVACGSGGGGNPSTPQGTFTLTVTGASTSGSVTLKEGVSLLLTVN